MKRKLIYFFAVIAIGFAIIGICYLWKHHTSALPEGLYQTNGRVEANQIELASKLAGRVTEVVPHEGDMLDSGDVVARLDVAEVEAQQRQVQAQAQLTRQSLALADATVSSRIGELNLAQQRLNRFTALINRGAVSKDQGDQAQQVFTTANAALKVAHAQVEESRSAIDAADAKVDQLKVVLQDLTIRSPIRGRVQYRLVEPGEVIAAGGRVATLIDLSDVSMTIFLPAGEAGRLVLGDEARVVLDAFPRYVFSTKVAFISAEAQFTPKSVETAVEREKLMFRAKLQAPPEMLKTIEPRIKSGLRGMAYVRVAPAALWPPWLAVRLPKGMP